MSDQPSQGDPIHRRVHQRQMFENRLDEVAAELYFLSQSLGFHSSRTLDQYQVLFKSRMYDLHHMHGSGEGNPFDSNMTEKERDVSPSSPRASSPTHPSSGPVPHYHDKVRRL